MYTYIYTHKHIYNIHNSTSYPVHITCNLRYSVLNNFACMYTQTHTYTCIRVCIFTCTQTHAYIYIKHYSKSYLMDIAEDFRYWSTEYVYLYTRTYKYIYLNMYIYTKRYLFYVYKRKHHINMCIHMCTDTYI